MIDLNEVGAAPYRDAAGHRRVRFGLYLPGITYDKGYRVRVRVIHARDQFVREIEPRVYDLFWHKGSPLDLWDTTVDLTADAAGNFGAEGRYLYRFQLLRGEEVVTFWFADPFGRAAGRGTVSAFDVEDAPEPFDWNDGAFRVPEVDRMIVYELHVGEFNETFDGLVAQLPYLRSLGVNVLELMPVSNVKEDVEWGYTPLGYFAPDDRYGGPEGMKRLVRACHEQGIAVIVDAVYAHAHPEFPYNLVYETSGEPNPMMGPFAEEFFARAGVDYDREFAREYFFAVNRHWLEEYHVDGFRYDYVPGMLDGPTGNGYAALVHHTYRHSQQPGAFPRFAGPDGRSLIIQCAEHLPDARGILSTTYSNTCWQNGLLDEAGAQAGGPVRVSFAHQLDPELIGYPSHYRNPATGEVLPAAPFQYLESHDHSRFINRFGEQRLRDLLDQPYGDRGQFYRTQPYVIALYTCKGVPMLWHGQEFGENWSVPSGGLGRVLLSRPLHWEYFYDPMGKALIRLYRIMASLRSRYRALQSRGYLYYYDDPFHRRNGIVAYRRRAEPRDGAPAEDMVVVLNFSDRDVDAWIPWPAAGSWRELIDEADGHRPSVQVQQDGEWKPVRVPSSYGAVYLHQ
ncbi:MAG TPA: alpha-amylase family glycosyl hydrolase [Longimicrobiaceae bacterium]|nr:alpha-amylase family glycosyl hydrolase [Longimicrobiaceae bacterium]